MTLSIKNGGYTFIIRLDIMFLCHYAERVPVVTNFKQPVYQTFKGTLMQI